MKLHIKITSCVVALAWATTACSSSSSTSRGLPPASSTPATVVRAYLAAAGDGDCTVTKALTVPKATWHWCHDPKLLAYRSIGAAAFVPASEAGVDEECVDFEMDTHGSSDGSMPVGWQPWGLCLVHTKSGWRVHDQGQG